jgi:lipopolysaccharide heptosyltransferase II
MTGDSIQATDSKSGVESPVREPQDGYYDRRYPFGHRLVARRLAQTKRAAQRIIWVLLAAVGWLTSFHLGSRRPLRARDRRIRRILVVRVDLIGDVVLSLPAVRALRRAYPEAEIDMLVLPSTADILAGQPDVAHVLTYNPNIWRRPISLVGPRNWQGVRDLVVALRGPRYDLCVSVAGDVGSVLTRLSGARRRVGYADEAYPWLLTDAVPGGRYTRIMHEVEYVQEIARAAGGVVTAQDARPVLHLVPEAAEAVGRTLHRLGLDGNTGPLVALHASAQNGWAKRWPAAQWAALANRLTGELGARVILTGAAGDRPLTAAIAARARNGVYDLAGGTTLSELAALLVRCDLVVSGDSGPLHIACAVGTAVVGLYGPTDPRISGPLGDGAIVLRREIWCAPCYNARATADCRFSNPVCMKGLSADAVFAAARRQLMLHAPAAAIACSRTEADEHAETPGQKRAAF